MDQFRSINFRFSGVFLFVVAVVIVLGSFSAWRLSAYRTYSGELRDRFFSNTRYIGDLITIHRISEQLKAAVYWRLAAKKRPESRRMQ